MADSYRRSPGNADTYIESVEKTQGSGEDMKSAVSTSDTLGLMLRDLDQFPMPDHEQQVELAKRVVAGDDAARKQMVAANLRLVVHWARRYQDRGVDMADLV